MAVFPLYSKQQAAAKDGGATVYQHDVLCDRLRKQITNILDDIIGGGCFTGNTVAKAIWQKVEKTLCHEYGVPALLQPDERGAINRLLEGEDVRQYFRAAQVPICLDIIQVTLHFAKEVISAGNLEHRFPEMTLEEGVKEINLRFKEHGVGFQIVDGQILRIDSDVTFQQATLPALTLLREPYLAGANQEFLSAHDHFRHGRYKECLNECLKAFESTMKAICHKRKWPYNQSDTAKTLIKVCEDNKLFPVFMTSHVTGLRTCLESGVPTARNKTSGHGQGVTPIVVREEFASYVLTLTAANILLLVNSDNKLT